VAVSSESFCSFCEYEYYLQSVDGKFEGTETPCPICELKSGEADKRALRTMLHLVRSSASGGAKELDMQ
jgi:hypothetical protein